MNNTTPISKKHLWVIAVLALAAAAFIFWPGEQQIQAENNLGNTFEVIGNEVYDTREILLQEALSQNLTVSEKDVTQTIIGLQQKANMSEDAYQSYILENQPSWEAFEQQIEENLLVLKIVNQNVNWSRLNVTDEAIDEFIAENQEIVPLDKINSDPEFKAQFYKLAKQQLYEKQKQELVDEYVRELVEQNS